MSGATGIDDVPCPDCGRPFGAHTIVEFREHTATNLPLEQVDEMIPASTTGQVLADHLDIAAVVLQADTRLAGTLYLPGVEFRFRSSDGRQFPSIVFVADDESLFRDLGKLVQGACGAAPMRAKQARRQAGGGQ